jgi:hypothetical protein
MGQRSDVRRCAVARNVHATCATHAAKNIALHADPNASRGAQAPGKPRIISSATAERKTNARSKSKSAALAARRFAVVVLRD